MWVTHVVGKLHHNLLEKSLMGITTQTQTERKRKHFRNAAFWDTKVQLWELLIRISNHLSEGPCPTTECSPIAWVGGGGILHSQGWIHAYWRCTIGVDAEMGHTGDRKAMTTRDATGLHAS